MGWNFDGAVVTVEAGFGSGPFTAPASITWTDITGYVRNIPNLTRDGRTNEYDQFQPGTATVVVNNRDRTFDATYGPAYTSFTAGAGGWSAGDLAAFSGASQLDVRFAMSLDDWSPAAVSMVASQLGSVGNYSWQVFVDTSGFLNLTTSNNGTATTTTDSGCRVSAADGQLMCGRVTWTTTAGAVNFYIKRTTKERARADCLDNDGWQQIGVTETGQTTTLFNSTANVQVGDRADAPVLAPAGKVYYCDARTTIGSSTLRFAFWPADAASAAATSWVASAGAGETWTKVGSPTLAIQGTHYGDLVPGTPLRVKCDYDATTYQLWYGYVRRFEQDGGDLGLDATVTINALTGLGWLFDKPAPDSVLGIDVDVENANGDTYVVNSFLKLTEGGNTPTYFDQVTRQSVVASGTTLGAVDVPYSAGSARILDSTTTGALSAPLADPAPLGQLESTGAAQNSLSFMFWLYASTSEFGLVFKYRSFYDGSTIGFAMNYRSDDKRIYQEFGSYNYTVPTLSPGWHTVSIDDGEDLFFETWIYIDGVRLTRDDTFDAYDFASYPWLYANGTRLGGTAFANFRTGGLAARSSQGRKNEIAGERLEWLLSAAGVPSTLQAISTDPSVFLGPAGYGGNYGQLCQAVNTAEQGRFYTAGDGMITFLSKMDTYTEARSITSQATFGDLDTMSYSDLTVDPASVDTIVNSVTVTTPEGATATYKDTTSIALYGESSSSLSGVPLSSSGDCLNLATYLVGLRAYPATRVTSLTLDPRSDPTNLFPQVLDREIGDRITINRRITETLVGGVTTDSYLSAQVTIEGIAHSIDRAGVWKTTYTTAPATPTANEGGYFTADDAVLSVVDSGVVAAP